MSKKPKSRAVSAQQLFETAVGLYSSGNYVEALSMMNNLLKFQPENIVALNITGVCTQCLGRQGDAEKTYRSAIRLRPDHADAYFNLGGLLHEQQHFAEAEETYRRAISLRPDYVDAHYNLGRLLHELKHFATAEEAYRRALFFRPDYADAHNNLGNLFKEQKRFAAAEEAYRRALFFRPDYADAWYNLGNLLKEQKRFAEAEESYCCAISLSPDHVAARFNLGNLFHEQQHLAEAEQAYRRTITLRPDYAEARWNLSMLLLSQGRFEEGWPLLEARYDQSLKETLVVVPDLPYPQWTGEPLTGKSILVCPEQGFGDQIQFVRYLPLLKALGAARVTLLCKQPLASLFCTAPGVDMIINVDNTIEIESHDFWSLPLSLPLRFRTTLETIPANLPYLSTSEDRVNLWADKLPPGFKVGLVWKGSDQHKNDRNRSLPGLEILKPLWSVPGISFVSLQKGNGADEASIPLPNQPIVNLGPDIRDFADTAAVIQHLDLVVSVDTSVVHLSGALGKPCWVLLPCINTDWRWLEEREDSPWYPRVMRLYRQETAGDWESVVGRVAEELRRKCIPPFQQKIMQKPKTPKRRPVSAQHLFETAVGLYSSCDYVEALAMMNNLLVLQPENIIALNIAGVCAQCLGKQGEAEETFCRAISLRPDHSDAYFNLGNLLMEEQHFAKAEEAFRHAISLRPDYVDAHYNLGRLLHKQKHFVAAEEAYRSALMFRPDYVDALNNLGNLLKEQELFVAAEEAYRRALFFRPDYADAYYNLGNLFKEQKHLAGSEEAYRHAISLRPDHAAAYYNLGNLLLEQELFAEAEEAYRRTISLRPDHVDAYFSLGCLLLEQEHFAAAEESYHRVLTLQPDYVEALNSLGSLFRNQQHFAAAEDSYRRAIILRPDYADAHANLGNLLKEQNRFAESEESYRRAIILRSDHTDAHYNLGVLLNEQKRFVESEESYRRAIILRPDFVKAQWNLSLLLLFQGRFAEGWPLHEARYGKKGKDFIVKEPDLPYPQWMGEPLTGKSILVCPEQGFGDQIQFVRYLPLLKALGASRVTLVCMPPLTQLFRTAPGVDKIVSSENNSESEPYDYWTFPLSLPLRFRTTLETIPANLPYLSTSADRLDLWAEKLPPGFKVGLVWKGNDQHKNDRNRSLPSFETLKPLWSVSGISFVSLQKGSGEDEAANPSSDQPILNLGSDIRDFADTAAIIQQLDLVVSVDTSVVHLSGALGKPCWVLLPCINTDWRWLEGREDTPWYPDVMRLFRQTTIGDWESVIGRVIKDLKKKCIVPFRPTTMLKPKAPKRPAMSAQHLAETALGLYTSGNHVEALAMVKKLLKSQPKNIIVLNIAGVCAQSLGKQSEAEETFRRAITLCPDHADAYFNLGGLLKEQDDLVGAEETYRRAIFLRPDYADAHFNLGNLLKKQQHFAAAEETYRRAISIRPDYADAHFNLGNLLYEQQDFSAAEEAYRRVLSLRPDHVEAYNNLGNLLKKQQFFAAAEEAYRLAISIRPDFADAHNNLGNLLKEQKRFAEAEDAYRRAVSIQPDYDEVQWNLSLLLLFQGRFAEGWPFHEARYGQKRKEIIVTVPDLPWPQWKGEPLTGKSIIVCPEQGFGDQIQFIRYLPLLKSLGAARVTLICPLLLTSLFHHAPGVDMIVSGENIIEIEPHDFWTFPLSLPLRFRTTLETIPANLPYLTTSEERLDLWAETLPPGFKVGLVWKGSVQHNNDRNRSLPSLETLKPLWSVPGISFVSLQKGNGEDEAVNPSPNQPILNLGPFIRDFADTAAIIHQLDLVVSVDTAIVHLAGALGKPCWVLLPCGTTDWRWLDEREDSPWYPGVMRLYRQATVDDWATVVGRVAEELRNECLAFPRQTTMLKSKTPGRCAVSAQHLLETAGGLYSSGNYVDALAMMNNLLELQPENIIALNVAGVCAQCLGKHGDAEESFRRAISLHPDHADAYFNLGGLLHVQQHYVEAEEAYCRAISLRPDYVDAHYNLGRLLHEQKNFATAEEAYSRVILLQPDYVEAHNNLGFLLKEQKHFAAAEEAYCRAISIRPDYAEAKWNLSTLLLFQGRFEEGWRLHEARYDQRRKEIIVTVPDLPCPQWTGEPLTDKSIIVCPEQGLGDQIQFIRYLPLLKALGAARVTLVCTPSLAPLFRTAPGVDMIISGENTIELEPHDYWTFPLSLPLRFRTTLETIPANLPYLLASEDRLALWAKKLPPGCKVGLVWKGNDQHKNDSNRSLSSLEVLKLLWSVPGISFVSLQKGNGEDEAANLPPNQPMVNLGPDIRDFADTAAIIQQLDLVVSVDTAVAHLAGALGKPCWVLLPCINTDWRWLDEREDSPWYPGVMWLFRQETVGDWESVVGRVAEELREKCIAPFQQIIMKKPKAPKRRAVSAQRLFETAVGLYSSGDHVEALAMMKKLLKLQPKNIIALNIAGVCAQCLGRQGEAEETFRRAISLQPDYVEAHINLGNLLHAQKHFSAAEESYRSALTFRPDHADAHYNLGNLLIQQEHFAEAEDSLRRTLFLRPDYVEAHNNLGSLLQAQKHFAAAEESYRRALTLRPDYVEAHNNLGNLLMEQEFFAAAEESYRRALSLRPDYVEAHNNLGNLLLEQKHFVEAEEIFRRAISIQSDHADAHYNLGNLLYMQEYFDAADEPFRRAISLRPDFADAYNNLGNLLKEQKCFAEAEETYGRAISIQPGFAEAQWNLSLLLLSQGRFAEGWPLHEARFDKSRKKIIVSVPDFTCPQWMGEPLFGKSIIVCPEQGFGDQIQFVRYLPLLKALGATRVTLICRPTLMQLFCTAPGVDMIISGENTTVVEPHDFWTFPMSLPLRFRTTLETIPANLPYLSTSEDRLSLWAEKLPPGFKIGLVWKGNDQHKNDRNRSLPSLETLKPLWSVPGISFVSLQKGNGEDEAANPPPDQPILNLGPDIRDFADTAAIIEQLDLVVSVDTAVVHLAGALGKPCWLLLPRINTDWRWLEEREGSPWYPGVMRLFRQTTVGDWATVVGRVAEDLRRKCIAH